MQSHIAIVLALSMLSLVSLSACAHTPDGSGAASPSTATGPASAPQTSNADVGPVACDLVCEAARVERRAQDEPDYHARATANANAVLGQAHPDMLACYKTRLTVQPTAHGFITIDIVVGPDGRVLDVSTTGGAILGKATMSCIVERVKRAVFEPPHGGGTLRIQVPFSLRKLSKEEDA